MRSWPTPNPEWMAMAQHRKSRRLRHPWPPPRRKLRRRASPGSKTVRSISFILLALAVGGHPAEYLMLTGAYTGGPIKGIYAFHLSTTNGKLSASGVAVETPNPTFLVEHPSHRFVYAV